ncbi:MAG: heat-inducible transcriptional repressor HrcA [Anaerolineae bacterium]
MEELTPRRQAILGLVVRAYIETAQPIGSKALVERFGLKYSPATIRNELAALEELGYLTHPHTSAGRVPTEAGYRYFVEHLLGQVELPLSERLKIQHQFHQAQLDLDQWARLAAAVLAHTARTAALATPPKAPKSQFKHLELISLHDTIVLLVLVLMGGLVKQQMLTLDGPATQSELSRISNELNDRLAGLTSEEIRSRIPLLSDLARQVALLAQDIMRRVDGHETEQIYREGLSHILEDPAFVEGDTALHIVQVLEQRPLLEDVWSQLSDVNAVQVVIGGEGRWDTLRDVSLVLARYGLEGRATGILGVIGPTRMPYARAISAVRYVSSLMSEMLRSWYGEQPS